MVKKSDTDGTGTPNDLEGSRMGWTKSVTQALIQIKCPVFAILGVPKMALRVPESKF